jgi:hypothetical protein
MIGLKHEVFVLMAELRVEEGVVGLGLGIMERREGRTSMEEALNLEDDKVASSAKLVLEKLISTFRAMAESAITCQLWFPQQPAVSKFGTKHRTRPSKPNSS